MEIVLAKAAGFCFGVKRALELTGETADEAPRGTPIHTLGPLIHNPQVVAKLKAQGIGVIESPEDARSGIVIVRSHGAAPAVLERLHQSDCEIVDATCPFVQRAMNWARQLKDEGYQVIVVGDRLHPEVQAIFGYTDETAHVVSSPQEIWNIPIARRVGIIAQTTQSTANFKACVNELIGKVEELKVFDTICTATEKRQTSASELAAQVDIMIVVGGRNSANTKRLAQLCREQGTATYHIETARELIPEWFKEIKKAGVTAGASTPDWLIEGVLTRMSEFSDKKVAQATEELEAVQEEAKEEVTDAAHGEIPEQTESVVEEEPKEAEEEVQDVAEVEASEEAEEVSNGVDGEVLEQTEEEIQEAVEDEVPEAEAEEEIPAALEEAPEAELVQEEIEEPEEQELESTAETEPEAEDAESEAAEEPVLSEAQMSEYDVKMPTVGAIVKGRVVQISADEVMVDIDYKSEGRIPLNELSFLHGANPADIVSEGEEISVKVLKLDDVEGSVLLSKKRADADQSWQKLEELNESGGTLEAKVLQTVKGGLLVNVGVRGFIPASHVSRSFEDDLGKYVGQTLELKIIELDRSKNNVVFSHKEVLEARYQKAKEAAFEQLVEGTIVPGIVRRLTDFGAFVDIGSGVEGLLHVSEMAYSRVNHPSDVVSEGEEISVMVLGVNKERERISLGLKQTIADPWTKVAERYHVGDRVHGEVTRVVDFGVFVKLEDGIEGLVHISELAHRHVAKAEEVVDSGDEVEVKVISVDAKARRIGLSIKELEPKPAPRPAPAKAKQEFIPESDSEELTTNLGDMFGNLFKEEGENLGKVDSEALEETELAAAESPEEPEENGEVEEEVEVEPEPEEGDEEVPDEAESEDSEEAPEEDD